MGRIGYSNVGNCKTDFLKAYVVQFPSMVCQERRADYSAEENAIYKRITRRRYDFVHLFM